MRIIDIATTGNSNLKRSKLRTFLTLLAIAIGTFTLALSLGLGQGVKNYISSQLGSFEDVNLVQVTKANSAFPGGGFGNGSPSEYSEENQAVTDFAELFLSPEDIKKLEETPGVKEIIKPWSANFDYFIGTDNKKYSAPAEITLQQVPLNIVAGSSINNDETGKILVSRKYVESIGAESSESAIGKSVTFYYKDSVGQQVSEDFVIAGVFEPTLIDQPIKLSSVDAERIARAQAAMGEPQFIAVFVSPDVNTTVDELKQNLTDNSFDAQSLADINNTLNNIVTGVQLSLAAFSGIAILASVVGVINTLFMAVLERTREIGLYRALGAKPKTIFSLFSVEAALLGFWGSVFGLSFAYLAQFAINNIAESTFLSGIEGLQLLSITPMLALFIVVSIATITLLAGIIPAFKASRLDPIEALRYE
jgi:putative ABC transport system permease protein